MDRKKASRIAFVRKPQMLPPIRNPVELGVTKIFCRGKTENSEPESIGWLWPLASSEYIPHDTPEPIIRTVPSKGGADIPGTNK